MIRLTNIKQGDYGIKVNVTHDFVGTVKYKVDIEPELPLVDNSYFIIDASDTASIGTHTVIFIAEGVDLRVTSENVFRYKIYK